MAIYTLAEVEDLITKTNAAIEACLAKKEYVIGGRRWTNQDLPELRRHLKFLIAEKSKILAEAAGKSGVLQCVAFRPVR